MLYCNKCELAGNGIENTGVKERIKGKDYIVFCPKGDNNFKKNNLS